VLSSVTYSTALRVVGGVVKLTGHTGHHCCNFVHGGKVLQQDEGSSKFAESRQYVGFMILSPDIGLNYPDRQLRFPDRCN
jgi:hypothetical protein